MCLYNIGYKKISKEELFDFLILMSDELDPDPRVTDLHTEISKMRRNHLDLVHNNSIVYILTYNTH